MTTTEMIEVMQAYDRGEKIEYRLKDFMRDDEWNLSTVPPDWDWRTTDYRVKSRPTYRPYKNAEEFLSAQREHGMYITDHGMYLRPKHEAGRYELPTSIDDEKVVFILPTNTSNAYAVCYHYDNLLKDKVWQDGTPCGVKEE